MKTVAKDIAKTLKNGDTIAFYGDLGAGKSTLCREIIKYFCGENTTVPSPTYTYIQTYESKNVQIWHMDWYRANNDDELLELGIEEAFCNAICLVEWAQRGQNLLPKNTIHITIEESLDETDKQNPVYTRDILFSKRT